MTNTTTNIKTNVTTSDVSQLLIATEASPPALMTAPTTRTQQLNEDQMNELKGEPCHG
jgi:hypothetical protein